MRTREEQIERPYRGRFMHAAITQDEFRRHILEAEHRAEQCVRAEIARDSERLDWLVGTVQEIRRVSNRPTQWVLEIYTPLRSLDRDYLRQAIDAAREVG